MLSYITKTCQTKLLNISFGNAVGDIVENEIGGNVSFSGKDTGPIRPGKTGGGCWDCIIYNWTAKKLVMTSVTIEYMDGTELKISEKEIKYIR